MPAVNNLGNNVQGSLAKNYFNQIDDHKKLQSQKINHKLDAQKVNASNFREVLKTDLAKFQKNEPLKTLKSNIKESHEIKTQKLLKTDDGTDFALRKLSEDFEKQILGIMWNLAFQTLDKEFQGGIGEEIFHKELVNEMVKTSRTGEMGDIAASIYNDLKSRDQN